MNIMDLNEEQRRMMRNSDQSKFDHNGITSIQRANGATLLGPHQAQSMAEQHVIHADYDFTNLSHRANNHTFNDEMLLRALLQTRGGGGNSLDSVGKALQDATNDLLRYQMHAAENARLDAISKLESLKNDTPNQTFQMSTNHRDLLSSPPQNSSNKRVMSLQTTTPTISSPVLVSRKKTKHEDGLVFPLNKFEKKSHFPLPPITDSKNQSIGVGKMSFFRKTWARLERQSDRMDDTAADQEAFVREFFSRTVGSYQSDHLRKKLASMKRQVRM